MLWYVGLGFGIDDVVDGFDVWGYVVGYWMCSWGNGIDCGVVGVFNFVIDFGGDVFDGLDDGVVEVVVVGGDWRYVYVKFFCSGR